MAPRATTETAIEAIQRAVTANFLTAPKPGAIWKAIRGKAIARSIQVFLWKTIHSAHKIGSFWKHIKGHEERQNCAVCKVEENMDRILFKCTAPGRKEIWEAAKTV